MALGFVLVKVRPGAERAVYERLLKVHGLDEIFPLFGEHDFIVKLEAASFDELGQRIVGGIRSLPNVVSTHTLTATSLGTRRPTAAQEPGIRQSKKR